MVSHQRFFILLLESFALMKMSPLEVDRYLYGWWWEESDGSYPFPAPREVDWWLYKNMENNKLIKFVSGPSRGR